MFLHTKLEERKDPIRVAFIGCGKFVSMFLSQYSHLNKIEIDSIVDLNIDQAKKNCFKSGINEGEISSNRHLIYLHLNKHLHNNGK